MLLTVLIILAIMAAVIFVIVISSLLLINNVVAPVSAVSEAAKRISGGSYGYQMPNRYADEMGELVDNINDMSLKIGADGEAAVGVHLLRVPRAADAADGHQRLGRNAAGRRRQRSWRRCARGLNIIVKESGRLTNMVEELLDVLKMADGRFALHLEQMDLQAEFEDAVYTYRRGLQAARHHAGLPQRRRV